MKHLPLLALLACQSEPLSPPVIDVIVEHKEISEAGALEVGVAEAQAPQRILLIGDSEVQYMDWYLPRTTIKRSSETVFFDSKPGTTIGYWNNIFASEMTRYPRMDVVLIFLGTNNWPFVKYDQPLDNIVAEIKRRQVHCLWVGPTLVYGQHHHINDFLRDHVAPCRYFDTEAADIELLDRVHPTLKGGIKWLSLIWADKDSL